MADFLNIRVTEAELDLITLLLEQAGNMEDSTGQPAFELLHDLMEQAARPGEWNEPEDPDLFMDPVDFATKHDQNKGSSMAATRRAANFQQEHKPAQSDMQRHDVWVKPNNDPADW